jgi:ATP-binding cassette subfamily B protein
VNKEISGGKSLNLKIWSKLLPYLRQTRRHTVVVLVSMFLSSLLAASYPLFTSYAVDHFVVPGTTAGVPVFTVLFGLVTVIEGLAVILNVRHSMIVEMETGKMLKRDSFTHLQVLPLSYYSKNSVGYILARVMSDTDRVSGIIAWGFMHLAWNLCDMICMFVFMFILNARLALLLLAIIPVVGVVTWLFERKILVVNRRIRAVNALIVGAYNEGITGAKTSKTLVVEEDNAEEFRRLTAKMYGESVRSSYYSALLLPIIFLFRLHGRRPSCCTAAATSS